MIALPYYVTRFSTKVACDCIVVLVPLLGVVILVVQWGMVRLFAVVIVMPCWPWFPFARK